MTQVLFRTHVIGDVDALDENAGNLLVSFHDRRTDEIQEQLPRRHPGFKAQQQRHTAADMGFSGPIDFIEKFEVALSLDIRKYVLERLADKVAVTEQLAAGGVGEFKDVLRSAQHRHDAWRLLEQLP